MIWSAHTRPSRRTATFAAAIGLLIATVVLLAGPIGSASAYSKPAKGKWSVEDSFGDVKGGSMKVADNRKTIKKLEIKICDERSDACGGTATAKGLTVKSYKNAGGRYAYARLPKTGLFERKPTNIKVDGKRTNAKLMLLFDESGKLVNAAGLEYGDCHLNFVVRK